MVRSYLLATVLAVIAVTDANPLGQQRAQDLNKRIAAVTSAPPSTTCTIVPRTSVPLPSDCGVHGTLKTPDAILNQTLPASDPLPLETCTSDCVAVNSCFSFSFNHGTNECILYGKTLAQQGFQAARRPQNIVYYNKRCFERQCSTIKAPPSPVTRTTTTTTTTDVVSTTTTTTTSISDSVSTTTTTVVSTTTEVLTCTPGINQDAIVNGGFESGMLAPWIFGSNPDDGSFTPPIGIDIQQTNVNSGSYSAYIYENEGAQFDDFRLSQNVTVCPGLAYVFSFYAVAVDPNSCSLQSSINGQSSGAFAYTLGTTYQQFTQYFSGTTDGSTTVNISLEDSNCFNNFYVDDLSFTPLYLRRRE